MKNLIENLLRQALEALPVELVGAAARDINPEVERTRDSAHGDFASNLGLRLGKAARQNPRALAQALVAAIPADDAIAKVEVAGAGFINFFLKDAAFHREIGTIVGAGAAYGRSDLGAGRSLMVEFVSANPTGPLHVGHGRHAAFGATLANLLEAVGYRVKREYYVNDAGRQMEILAVSTWLRYLELRGERFVFPANGYRGEYILAIAGRLSDVAGATLQRTSADVFRDLPPDEPQGGDKDLYIDALIGRARGLLGADGFRQVQDLALGDILGDIREDLAEFGVTFDTWFSERSLSEDGSIDRALDALKAAGHAYLKDGALWFRSTAFGDEKDRVMVRENGARTYFASDIAYIFNKLQRGFTHLLYVLGADHHGYVRAHARRTGRARRPPGMLRSAPGAVRDAVPRRPEGADVDALRGIRDLAGPAPGSGQRCGAPVLRDAKQRPAPGLRPGAGDRAHQRQPGLLHPVRPCARRERDAPDAGTRAAGRHRERASEPGAADRDAGDAAAEAPVLATAKCSRPAPCSVRRTCSCITCATWPTTSTRTTARSSSSSMMPACAMHASRWRSPRRP